MFVRARFAALSVLLAASALAEEPVPPPKTIPQKLLTPEKVSDRVRHALKKKMKDHGRDMKSLPLAVVLLEYEKVSRLAANLEAEPRIDRSLAAEGAELSGLTDGYFYLQDQLRERAVELRRSAEAKDPKGVAHGLGGVADVCATCHAIYREKPKS